MKKTVGWCLGSIGVTAALLLPATAASASGGHPDPTPSHSPSSSPTESSTPSPSASNTSPSSPVDSPSSPAAPTASPSSPVDSPSPSPTAGPTSTVSTTPAPPTDTPPVVSIFTCPAGDDTIDVPFGFTADGLPELAGTVCVQGGTTRLDTLDVTPGWVAQVRSDGSRGRTEVRFTSLVTRQRVELRYEPGRTEIK